MTDERGTLFVHVTMEQEGKDSWTLMAEFLNPDSPSRTFKPIYPFQLTGWECTGISVTVTGNPTVLPPAEEDLC